MSAVINKAAPAMAVFALALAGFAAVMLAMPVLVPILDKLI